VAKRFDDDEDFETEMRKCVAETTVERLVHAVGFDALVKRWDKCINVSGGYVEK
jgi:hypothetical protein